MVEGETDAWEALARCLASGDLEGAAERAGSHPGARVAAEVDRLALALAGGEADRRGAGQTREAERLARRRRALLIFRDHGLDLDRLLPVVRFLPVSRGKILLAAVSGGAAHGRVCLRGGDDWHREILAGFREEVRDAGLRRARADGAGGAWVRIEAHGGICVFGGSEEFGECDRELAAEMIRAAFPGRVVTVQG